MNLKTIVALLFALSFFGAAQEEARIGDVVVLLSSEDDWISVDYEIAADFPEPARTASSTISCAERGLHSTSLDEQWLELVNATRDGNSVNVGDYTLACADGWLQVEGPTIADVLHLINDGRVFFSLDGAPPTNSVVSYGRIPGRYEGLNLVVELDSNTVSVTPYGYVRGPEAEVDRAFPAPLDAEPIAEVLGEDVVAVFQDGSWSPVLFDLSITPVQFEQAGRLHLFIADTFGSYGGPDWHHYVLDYDNATLYARTQRDGPSQDSEPSAPQ